MLFYIKYSETLELHYPSRAKNLTRMLAGITGKLAGILHLMVQGLNQLIDIRQEEEINVGDMILPPPHPPHIVIAPFTWCLSLSEAGYCSASQDGFQV